MRRTYVKGQYHHSVDFEPMPAGVYDQVVELVEGWFKAHGWRRDVALNPNEVADERYDTPEDVGEGRGPTVRGNRRG
jgi:hypothetical protein